MRRTGSAPFESSALPRSVTVYEVGARDGLQNEKQFVPTDVKIEFIERLSQTGLKFVEATSFVSPRMVPQVCGFSSYMHDMVQLTSESTRWGILWQLCRD